MINQEPSNRNNRSQLNISVGDIINSENIAIGENINITRIDFADAQNMRNHAVLRQAVRQFWVEGVLYSSLYHEIQLRLKVDARPDAVDNLPWNLVLRQPGVPNRALPNWAQGEQKRIIDIFDVLNQRMLILGEPGSGKTSTLLTLADELLKRNEADSTLPTPVVFNLSSWRENQPLDEWLVEELRTRYRMPKKVSQQWVEQDELMPLLDGLDEVAGDRRDACVAAINDFQREHVVALIVCSRTNEYESLTSKLQLQGAVAIRPLTQTQIDTYVEKVEEYGVALGPALTESDALRNLAQIPMLLNIMTLAFHDQNEDIQSIRDINRSEEQYIFDRYLIRMFVHRELPHLVSIGQTLQWLRWLAGQLVEQIQSIFLIERLQPDWLDCKPQINLYRLSFGLSLGLIFGLNFGLVAGLSAKLNYGLVGGLIGGISFGLGILLIFFVYVWQSEELSTRIKMSESLNFSVRNGTIAGLIFGLNFTMSSGLILGSIIALIFGLTFGLSELKSWKEIKDSWKESLLIGLTVGLCFGLTGALIIGLFGGLMFGLYFGLNFGLSYGWNSGLSFGLSLGLSCGLIAALISGLSSELMVGLNGELNLKKIENLLSNTRTIEVASKIQPSQGLWQSFKNGLLGGLIGGLGGLMGGLAFGLNGGLIGGIHLGLYFGLSFGLMLGVLGGIHFGMMSCLQHLILRLLLYRNNRIPWNYARFLDYSAARLFLRKVGGGYIFVHRMVLEHIAALTDDDIGHIIEGVKESQPQR